MKTNSPAVRVGGKPPVANIQASGSGLAPEQQPRHPAPSDPDKYPHYDVQSSIYSLLLSALTLSLHYEKYPGAEERQRNLELLLKEYLDTCKQIKIGT